MRLQLIRHLKTCTTDIYLRNECARVGLSIDAPVSKAAIAIDVCPALVAIMHHGFVAAEINALEESDHWWYIRGETQIN